MKSAKSRVGVEALLVAVMIAIFCLIALSVYREIRYGNFNRQTVSTSSLDVSEKRMIVARFLESSTINEKQMPSFSMSSSAEITTAGLSTIAVVMVISGMIGLVKRG